MGNCTEDETITVVGLGYIGLPTATLFASVGYKVHGFDINKKILEGLKQKNPHICL